MEAPTYRAASTTKRAEHFALGIAIREGGEDVKARCSTAAAGRHLPGRPYAIRIEASRPLTDQEMQRMAALVGYQYSAEVRGERFPAPARDSPFSFDDV